MKKQIATITGILGLIGIVTTAYMQLDSRYAHAMEFNQLQQRVLSNELNQSYRDTRKEVYELRALVRKYPNDEKLKQQLQESEDELKRLKALTHPKKTKAESGN